MLCIVYITLLMAVMGRTERSKVKTLSVNFGGQKAFNWDMNDPMKGISRLVSGRADPFEPTTEEILPNPTTEPQTVESPTLSPQKPVYPNPTIDYSNRTPVEEEKFKKVHAFVLCVVQNGYNCGKELGDIDITKHLGPPQNATDEGVTVSSSGSSTIPEYPSDVIYEQNSELTPFPEMPSTLSPENPTYVTDDYRTTVARSYKGHLRISKNTSKSNNSSTDIPDLVIKSSEQSELPETSTVSQTTGPFEPEENTFSEDNTTEGTKEKGSISSNTTFEHLNLGKINKIQKKISDLLSVPWLKYDGNVNQRSKNIVTPRPRTYIIVTTSRTTRDVDEEDAVDSESANDDISEIEPISESEVEDFSSNSDDEQTTTEDLKPEDTENNTDDPDTTGGLTATGNDEESSDDTDTGDVTATGSGEESSDDPFIGDVTTTGSGAESSDDPFADDVTATGSGEESSEDSFSGDVTTSGNGEESSDDPFAGDVTSTGNGEESSDDPFAGDVTSTGNGKESSDDPFAGDVTSTGNGEESTDEGSKNDKEEEETEEEDTKSDDKDNDDKTTTEKSDNDMGITVTGLDDFTVDIDFDDSGFDDESMFASSSDRILYKTDTERSVTVPPILIFGSTPKIATILPTNIVHVNDNTYAPFQTTSTEISVVTEVSVQRSPKQNFNSTKNSDSMFTKARNSLYSLLKLAKEFNID